MACVSHKTNARGKIEKNDLWIFFFPFLLFGGGEINKQVKSFIEEPNGWNARKQPERVKNSSRVKNAADLQIHVTKLQNDLFLYSVVYFRWCPQPTNQCLCFRVLEFWSVRLFYLFRLCVCIRFLRVKYTIYIRFLVVFGLRSCYLDMTP